MRYFRPVGVIFGFVCSTKPHKLRGFPPAGRGERRPAGSAQGTGQATERGAVVVTDVPDRHPRGSRLVSLRDVQLSRCAPRARRDTGVPELRRQRVRARVDVRRAGHAGRLRPPRRGGPGLAGRGPRSIWSRASTSAFQDADQVSVVALTREWTQDRPQPRSRHPPGRPDGLPPPRSCLPPGRARAAARRSQPERHLPERRAGRVGRPQRRRRADHRPLPPVLPGPSTAVAGRQPATEATPGTPAPVDRLLAVG